MLSSKAFGAIIGCSRLTHCGRSKRINEHPTVDPAWRLAIQREKNAHQLYSNALQVIADEALKKEYDFVAEEQLRHQKMMEDEYVKVFGKEPW